MAGGSAERMSKEISVIYASGRSVVESGCNMSITGTSGNRGVSVMRVVQMRAEGVPGVEISVRF